MTLDNATGLAVFRPISTIMESYSSRDVQDVRALSAAILTAAKQLDKAAKAGKMDESHGIARRISQYAEKALNIATRAAQED